MAGPARPAPGALLVAATRGWAVAGGGLLLAIVLVTGVNVAAFALDRVAGLWGGAVAGLPGFEEFVSLAVGAAALMILPYCQLRRGHVVVDVFLAAAPAGVRRGLDAFWLACTALVAVFLAGWMVAGLLESRADRVVSRVLGWPEWPFYLPGAVSLALWAAVAAAQLRPGDGAVARAAAEEPADG